MRGRGRGSSSRGRGDHGRGSVHTTESENVNQDLVQHTALIPRPDQGERSTPGAASSTPASVHTSATASAPIGLPPIASTATSASASGSCAPTGLRLHIHLVNSVMQPSDPIARRITLIFKEKLVADGFCWKNVPEEVKEFYWQEFKKHFLWEEAIEQLMKIAWRKIAAERYRSLMCSVRNGKEKRLSLTEGVMDAWQSAWGATEYKEKCKKFSNNRKSETGGQGAGPSRHCGGSISQYRHQQQMRERLGRDPLPHELFEATHKKKGSSEFVDARLKSIHDRFLTLKEQASQTDNDSSQASRVDEAQLYFEAVGGEKKRPLYGLGSQASVFFPNKTSANISFTSAQQNQDLQDEMADLRRKLQEREDNEQALIEQNVRITSELSQVKDLLMQLVSERQGNQPSAPGEGTSAQPAQPPDQADETNDEDEDENTTHL
ncbi:uncharacterized protein LOC110625725 [Manihot esculenta]|uniref:uncharacterized protein LOC110625725 n=1 Tax=Manihot esculenta TaxID=3983 RepID=UPI000B5D3E10|nr:uncharacterized protein LOC110625725 [Manihot esculenta]